ncbi:hypothetical protein D9758_018543 [Tetrapyrgos nigripes]|uniref:Uncharacterized protein n=1 Tax=Tetrapyrgos nigripes TaxID=182062 RepID=A0A8H5EZK3_9AGAR|nr:hypothetical protein D9758_018543 [Tetrapyrgos nigripes]
MIGQLPDKAFILSLTLLPGPYSRRTGLLGQLLPLFSSDWSDLANLSLKNTKKLAASGNVGHLGAYRIAHTLKITERLPVLSVPLGAYPKSSIDKKMDSSPSDTRLSADTTRSDTCRRCLSPGTDTDSTISVDSLIVISRRTSRIYISLKEGWHTSLQAAAVVSTLFAQTAAQFLGTVKTTPIPDTASQTALLIFSYGGIIFGYSATISSLFLNARIASLPVLAKFTKGSDRDKMPQLETQPIRTVMTWCHVGWKFEYLFWHFFVFVCVIEWPTSIAIPVAMGIVVMWSVLEYWISSTFIMCMYYESEFEAGSLNTWGDSEKATPTLTVPSQQLELANDK